MDANSTLETIVSMAGCMRDAKGDVARYLAETGRDLVEDSADLAELILDLDKSLTTGGALPSDWAEGR